MQHDRHVSPGDLVDVARADIEDVSEEEESEGTSKDVTPFPNRSLSTVVYTSVGGWLSGWEARFLDARRKHVHFDATILPPVIVAWNRVSVERIHEHTSFGVMTYNFWRWRFDAPEHLLPSSQQRLVTMDDSTDRAEVKPRPVKRWGRPIIDPNAPTQTNLFGTPNIEGEDQP